MASPGTHVGGSLTPTVNNWHQPHIVIFGGVYHSTFPRRSSRSRSRVRGRDAGGGGGGVGGGGGGSGGGVGVVSGVFTPAGGPFTPRTIRRPTGPHGTYFEDPWDEMQWDLAVAESQRAAQRQNDELLARYAETHQAYNDEMRVSQTQTFLAQAYLDQSRRLQQEGSRARASASAARAEVPIERAEHAAEAQAAAMERAEHAVEAGGAALERAQAYLRARATASEAIESSLPCSRWGDGDAGSGDDQQSSHRHFICSAKQSFDKSLIACQHTSEQHTSTKNTQAST